MKTIRILPWIAIACLGLESNAYAQQPAPVVLAVDISRSLSAVELGRVGEKLSAFVGQLPPETPAGLLVFADQPRWIAKPAAPPAGVAEGLLGLRPEGSFTLLYDALFAASAELEDGGVVVLVTDGRDENSATTLDDIARIYAERGIRIVAIGAGKVPATRDLRRLALLSSGSYTGTVSKVEPPALAADTAAALASVAGQRAAASAPPTVPAPRPFTEPAAPDFAPPTSPPATAAQSVPGAARTVPAASDGAPWWWWPVGIALALAALAAAALLLRRRGAPAAECPRCGTQLPAGTSGECSACRESTLIERLRGRRTAGPDAAIDAFLDTAVVPQWNLEERLERTAVMIEQPALVVREPGEPARSFALSEDLAFTIGREAGRNTLAIPSASMSAEHFRVVPDQGDYYLLDLQSTNGTFLNGQRVRAAKLAPGDRFRAGQVEFDFALQQQFTPFGARPKSPTAVPSAVS